MFKGLSLEAEHLVVGAAVSPSSAEVSVLVGLLWEASAVSLSVIFSGGHQYKGPISEEA